MVAPPDNLQALWEEHHLRNFYKLSLRHSKHKQLRQADRLVDAQKLIVLSLCSKSKKDSS